MKKLFNIYKHFSYKSKLAISYVILASIPCIISGIYFYNTVIRSVSESSNQIIEQTIQQELVGINSKINDIEKTGYLLSTSSSINKFFMTNYYHDLELIETMNNEVLPLISWFEATNKEFADFRFFTDNKFIPENEFFKQVTVYKNMDWYINMQKQLSLHGYYWETSHLSRPYIYSKDSQKKVYSLFYPSLINYSNNKTYLEINVSSEYLFGTMVRYPHFKDGYFIIVDDKGKIILSKNNNLNSLLQKDPIFISSLKKPKSSYSLTLDKSTYFVNTQKIDKLNTYIVSIVPEATITEPVNHAKNIFVIVFIIAAAGILVLSNIIASFLLARIRRMLEAVRKIQLGNFNINIPIYGEDEIDELAMDINIMANKISDLINKVYKSEIAQKETAIYALQAQINPHFLFNTLETFKMMAEINGQEDLSEGITSLGNLMRYNISIGKKFVEVQKELEIIEDYIQIQNLLLNNRITISYHIPPELMKCKMPILIMQPLVENSILHGFRDKLGILFIEICVFRSNDDLLIIVTDNGIGIERSNLIEIEETLKGIKQEKNYSSREKSIGLVNVNNRLMLYFGDEYGLTLDNAAEGGFKVVVKLPYYLDI